MNKLMRNVSLEYPIYGTMNFQLSIIDKQRQQASSDLPLRTSRYYKASCAVGGVCAGKNLPNMMYDGQTKNFGSLPQPTVCSSSPSVIAIKSIRRTRHVVNSKFQFVKVH